MSPAKALAGVFATIAVAGTMEAVHQFWVPIPNRMWACLLPVVWASFAAGLRSGPLAAGVAVLYGAWAYSEPGFSAPNAARFAVGALTIGGTSLLVGLLRGRVERAAAAVASASAARRHIEILQDLDAVIWEADVHSLAFTFVSRRSEDILGLTPEEWLRQFPSWGDHIHPEDRDVALALCRGDSGQGKDFALDYRCTTDRGETVWVRDSVRTLPGLDGSPAQLRGIMLDVTERKLSDVAMQQGQERLALVGRVAEQARGKPAADIVAIALEELAEYFRGLPVSFARLESGGRFVVERSMEPAAVPCLGGYSGDLSEAGAWTATLREGRPALIADAARDPRAAGLGTFLAAGGRAASLDVPLRHPDGGTGILSAGCTEPRDWGDHEVASVEDLSRWLETALSEARAEEERRAAQKALAESQAVLYDLFENINDLIQQASPDGRLLYVNRAWREALGYSVNELRELRIGDILHSSCRERALAIFARALAGETVRGAEVVLVGKSGRAITVEGHVNAGVKDGVPLFTRAIFRDVSERKVAELALKRSEEHFRSLIENAQDLITVLDEDGVIRYQSASAAHVLGLKPEEMVGHGLFDFVHPGDVESAGGALERALRDPGVAQKAELRLRRSDGTWRAVEAIGTGMIEESGLRKLVVNSRDITERKDAESALKASEAALRQSLKMEAVGRLAGGVAHDFNNLLTVVMSYSELLLETMDAGRPERRSIEEIRKAAERAASLTQQLLAFSRRQVVEPAILDLNAVVSEMREMLARVIGEDVRLETALAADLGAVLMDRGQIENVIVNLSVNARDAMPKGGTLTIRTDSLEVSEDEARLHPGIAPGSWVLLTVVDTGVGMDAATRARIFEPFFTTKPKGKGTGLGLSTVWGIVKAAGGHPWVFSEPGQGATFRIYLPRAQRSEETDLSKRPATQLAGAPRGTETLLLAEDEDAVRALTKSVLEMSGYRVLEARNGAEALQIASEYGGTIDALVTDVVMPGMSGRDLARKLAPMRPGARVLYVSGYTDNAIAVNGQLEPGTQFLPKPFTPRSLAIKVREVLDAPEAASQG